MSTRNTDYHGWEIPDSDAYDPENPPAPHENWHEYLNTVFDAIDAQTFARFAEGESPPDPGAGVDDRFLVNDTIETDWVTLQFDSSTRVGLDGPFTQIETAQRWDNLPWAWGDREQEIYGQWAFYDDDGVGGLATLNADISGNAYRVSSADVAETALDADAFDSNDPDVFASTLSTREITAAWAYGSEATFESGMDVTGGALELPVYDEVGEPTEDTDDEDDS